MSNTKRIWLTDFIRGIAILMVVTFHLVFNLNYFYDWPIKIDEDFWFYFGRLAAILFLLSLGMVTAFIFQRKVLKKALEINIRRSLRLLLIALIITIVTRFFYPEKTIWFGILHVMGLSILINLPLGKKGMLNLVLGGLVLSLGNILETPLSSLFWLPFGLSPRLNSFDYYPLIPWLGLVLIGCGLGNILYKKIVQIKPPQAWQKVLIILGKNSLWIYLIHQPILLGILWLFL